MSEIDDSIQLAMQAVDWDSIDRHQAQELGRRLGAVQDAVVSHRVTFAVAFNNCATLVLLGGFALVSKWISFGSTEILFFLTIAKMVTSCYDLVSTYLRRLDIDDVNRELADLLEGLRTQERP